MKETNPKEDKAMLVSLVLIPLGLLSFGWIWYRYGFLYGLLTAAIYAFGAYKIYFAK